MADEDETIDFGVVDDNPPGKPKAGKPEVIDSIDFVVEDGFFVDGSDKGPSANAPSASKPPPGPSVPAPFFPFLKRKDEESKEISGGKGGLQSFGGGGADGDASAEGPKKQRMGERMVEMGLITADQLNVALQEKKISNKMLGEILVELGFIDEDTLTMFLAETSG